MKFGLFTKNGALNSEPVFMAFQQGLAEIPGATFAYNDMSADVAVIWSTVWAGRMKNNLSVWQQFRSSGRPVVVLEVGSLIRGSSWRMSVNTVRQKGFYGQGVDPDRVDKFNLLLCPWRETGRHIVIALQRGDSEQWKDQPRVKLWLEHTVDKLRQYTDRPIIVRNHPRKTVRVSRNDIVCQTPGPVEHTYDSYDFDQVLKNAWAVVNHNSGSGVIAAISGIPIFVDKSSLAAPVGNYNLSDIEDPIMYDRQQWLSDICHTEWFLDEIASGIPIMRLWPAFC